MTCPQEENIYLVFYSEYEDELFEEYPRDFLFNRQIKMLSMTGRNKADIEKQLEYMPNSPRDVKGILGLN